MTDRMPNAGRSNEGEEAYGNLPDAIVAMLKELKEPDADLEKLARQVDSYTNHSDRALGDWSFPCLMRDTRWNPDLFQFLGPRIRRFPQMEKFYVYLNNRLADEELVRYDTMDSYPKYHVTSVRGMLGAERLIQTLKRLETLRPEVNRMNPKTCQVFKSEYHYKIHLLWASRPAKTDDMANVAMQLRAVNFSEETWMQIIIRNPLWSKAVAHLLELPGLEALAWWYYAHSISTIDSSFNKFEEFDFHRWTENSVQEFRERKFDYVWLSRIAEQLDQEMIYRFIDQAVAVDEYVHDRRPAYESERLRYLTQAWFGQLSRATVFKRATTKRHQDSIQAIGVLKLAEGLARDEDLSQRLQVLREIKATRKKVGAQRQENEQKHIGFALDALSHQAKLENSQELWWKSELEEIELLCGEPLGVKLDDLTVELVVQDDGMPELKVERKDKPLKAIPAAAKKDTAVAELVQRRKLLISKHKQIAQALDEAMVTQEKFSANLFQTLAAQQLPAALMRVCVWKLVPGNGDPTVFGFPTADFHGLEDSSSGKVKKLTDEDGLILAHPVDLVAAGCLVELQNSLTQRGGEQPFKQLNREYTAAFSEEERKQLVEGFRGTLLGARVLGGVTQARKWIMHHASEPCEFRKKFLQAGCIASLILDGHFFSAIYDEDGLGVETLEFVSGETGNVMPYAEVPPVVFSEGVRDVELFMAKA